jgi:hypothetical protein
VSIKKNGIRTIAVGSEDSRDIPELASDFSGSVVYYRRKTQIGKNAEDILAHFSFSQAKAIKLNELQKSLQKSCGIDQASSTSDAGPIQALLHTTPEV